MGRAAGQDEMTDDTPEVLGSCEGYYFVVNQIKAHYLAACHLLAGRVDRPEARTWIFPKVLESCADCIDNIVDRLARLHGITRRNHEKKGAFLLRVCDAAGIQLGDGALANLKELVGVWNDLKHSGHGETWGRTVTLATLEFTIAHFELTTAIVAAYYRLLGEAEQPEWIRRPERQRADITLLPLAVAGVEQLMASREVYLKEPATPPAPESP